MKIPIIKTVLFAMIVFVNVQTDAFAHPGTHPHPHGISSGEFILLIAIVVLGWAVWRWGRRRFLSR
uniref:Uncharacterized protein n=1 Tax=Candidatus Kentrum sp. SD TaxID=2126332 RepID=A0A450YGM4_9GAMM|nr:MAG: hypothetical protein BECKSD772F_GA0070984_106614 [Candidatus Kentron sp. SD]VFK46141.1 MAG: hypothetical protein BECKSD772E_GA0070983_106714 [Candidatus Kentron sp. SD]VFK80900.1 MAG: hypothetical protein BECKSD772D_GA0070982_11756 [Candidatus Kentron sp. SD]